MTISDIFVACKDISPDCNFVITDHHDNELYSGNQEEMPFNWYACCKVISFSVDNDTLYATIQN